MARPRKHVDAAEVVRLRREGLSFPEISRRMRLSVGKVHQAHRNATDAPQPFINLSKTILQTTLEDDTANPDAESHLGLIPAHGEPSVLGSVYVRQNTADRLQLCPDGSFVLQEAGRTYRGNFSLVLKSPELTGGQAAATIQGEEIVDQDGCAWIRADRQSLTLIDFRG
jgi:hypothetical protein